MMNAGLLIHDLLLNIYLSIHLCVYVYSRQGDEGSGLGTQVLDAGRIEGVLSPGLLGQKGNHDTVFLTTYLYPSISIYLYLCIHLCIHLSIYLSVYLCIYLMYLSIHLYISMFLPL